MNEHRLDRRAFLLSSSAMAILTTACGSGSMSDDDGTVTIPEPPAPPPPPPEPEPEPEPARTPLAGPNRYMFWASGAKMPSGNPVTAAANTTHVMTKLIFGSPQYAINNLRLHFSGFASTEGGASPQETVLPGNATTILGVWVEVGGTATRATFDGANGTTIASGSLGAWTDDLDLTAHIPAESPVTIYTLYSTADGEVQIPVYQVEKHRGERVWAANNAATLEAMIGSSSNSSPALDRDYGHPIRQQMVYGPDFMVAKGWDGRPVPLVVCDSIGERQNDGPTAADARRNKGWLRRWLDRDGSNGRTPHCIIGLPGASSDRELAAGATLRWDVLDQIVAFNGSQRPFTCVANQHGRNDFAATLADMKAKFKGLNDRILARHPGTPIIGIGQVVHSNSTDSFRTVANQGYQTGGEWPNGLRYQFEAEKESLMDGTLSGYVEVVRACGLDTLQGKWPAPFFTTRLAAAVGAGETELVLEDAPMLGEFVHYGSDANPAAANIVEISGSAGAWRCKADRTLVATSAGAEVFAPNANDGTGNPRTGTHPRPRMSIAISERVPQSEKAKLR